MATTIRVDTLDEESNVVSTTMMVVEEAETTSKQILDAVETSKWNCTHDGWKLFTIV